MQHTNSINLKGKYKNVYLRYIIAFIVITSISFYVTIQSKSYSYIQYGKNYIYYNKLSDKEANMFLETLKEKDYLNQNTKFKLFVSKDKNSYLIMITENTFSFSDDEENLKATAKILSEDLDFNIEFGKCTSDFKKIKSIVYKKY